MKKRQPTGISVVFVLLLALATMSIGCSTTRTEHGVQIQEKRGLNPLDYIPW